MAIYKGKFLPENAIVEYSGIDRLASRVSKEWLYHTDNNKDEYIPEHPIAVRKNDKLTTNVLNNNKILEDIFDSNGKQIKHEQFYFKNNKT